MKKNILAIAFIIYSLNLFAQKVGDVQPNNTETDCNMVSKTLDDLMALNKPVLIEHAMNNCGACRESAPEISAFVEKNVGNMTFILSMSRMIMGNTTCKNLTDWQAEFVGYKNAFAFLDNDKTYQYGTGFMPTLTVINPATKKIMYIGNDFEVASKMLTAMMPTAVESEAQSVTNFNLYPNPAKGQVNIGYNMAFANTTKILVLNSLGVEVASKSIAPASSVNESIGISHLSSGIYTIQVIADNVVLKNQKLVVE